MSLLFKSKTKMTKNNIFEMKNTARKRIYDMMDRTLANRLDETYGFEPLQTGSFTELYQRRVDKQHNELLAKIYAVGPVKAGISIAVAAQLGAIVTAASLFADVHIPGAGAGVGLARLLLVGTVTWAAEMAVMAAGFGSALLAGKGLGEAITYAQNKRAGLSTELIQFADVDSNSLRRIEPMLERTAFGRKQAMQKEEVHLHLEAMQKAVEAIAPEGIKEHITYEIKDIMQENTPRYKMQEKVFEALQALPQTTQWQIIVTYSKELENTLLAAIPSLTLAPPAA